jgi:hypothetical protein
MRLRLIDRVRRYIRPGLRGSKARGPARSGSSGMGSAPSPSGAGRHRRDYGYRPAVPVDTAPPSSFGKPAAEPPAAGQPPAELPRRVPRRSRSAGPAGPSPARPGFSQPSAGQPSADQPSAGQPSASQPGAGTGPVAAGQAQAKWVSAGQARAAIRPGPGQAAAADRTRAQPARPARAEPDAARPPWYEVAHARRAAEGLANCGPLEKVLHREWPASLVPSAPVVRAVNRLAGLPQVIKEILATGLDAIHVGEGGVPELDDMARLRGVPLPSGRATWDACAGAYGQRKIIVGSRPSSAPDVMCHEVGHALDDIDRVDGRWQSDSVQFRELYQRCQDALVSDFHRQPGDLGRREFFADAFAAIASQQRPALVDMLGGNTRVALDVMLYFNIRYGL